MNDLECDTKRILSHVRNNFNRDIEVLDSEIDLIDHARDILKGKGKINTGSMFSQKLSAMGSKCSVLFFLSEYL